MWSVTYTLKRLIDKRATIPVGSLKIYGAYKLDDIYIQCVWKKTKEGKVYNPHPVVNFNKFEYKGDERLCKYILKYFGPGFYSVVKPLGKGKGFKSVFYGEINRETFHRYKREFGEVLETGLAPHLTSTMPIGVKHNYQ